jgi:tRNA modification GTPase
VRLSAVTGEGLHNLEEALLAATLGTGGAAEAAPVASERQRDAVQRALDAARAALEGSAEGWPADVVALDIRAAAEALGEVTGETASDDLLAMIFSTFCVGK